MASFDELPPDQRAVLDLVLRRGRSYDDIARLLQIDRAAVRARALAAFDELGPETGLAPESRGLITDYLLRQLPDPVAEQTRERLLTSPSERAWARVLASSLEPTAGKPLPEIPDGAGATAEPAIAEPAIAEPAIAEPRTAAPATAAPATAEPETAKPETAKPEAVKPATASPATAESPAPAGKTRSPKRRPSRSGRHRPRPTDRRSSRLGGAIFLGVGALAVIALVVVLILVLSGGSSNHSPTAAAGPAAATGTGAGTTSTGTSTTGTSTSSAQIVGQTNLNPPSGSGSAKGIAVVVKAGNAFGVVIEAQGVAPNQHNAYAVWLYNSPTDSARVGFVNPGVGKNGRLQSGGQLPANASHYKTLLLTLETQNNPKSPGTVILQGPLKGVS